RRTAGGGGAARQERGAPRSGRARLGPPRQGAGSHAPHMTPMALPSAPIRGGHHSSVMNRANASSPPNAVKTGQKDGFGMCRSSGGRPVAGARISAPSSRSGSRLRTVGMYAKLYGAGGDVVAHSSVYAPHGLSPAGAPRRQLRSRFHAKTSTPAAWMNAPTVSMK